MPRRTIERLKILHPFLETKKYYKPLEIKIMSKKNERPYITVIDPDGTKRREYVDREGIEQGWGNIITDILRAIFK
jgi:hypothetical protein